MSGKYARPQPKAQTTPWPLVLVGVGLVLLGVVAWLAWPRPATTGGAPIEVQGAPRLKVDKAVADLGDVPLGQPVAAQFTLTNVGDQPLRFTEPPWTELVEGC